MSLFPDRLAATIRSSLMGADPREVEFAVRGFHRSCPDKVARLEGVGAHFIRGYRLALEQPEAELLGERLDDVAARDRGFHYEGAGMALAALDLATPWRRDRLDRFLAGAGDAHTYMVHIGAGWAWARLGVLAGQIEARLAERDPVLGPLALDGYGFHEAFFKTERFVDSGRLPRSLERARIPAFDSGVGRALWFVGCAEPDRISATVEGFAPERHEALWAGIGLACCYAGGANEDELAALLERGARHRAAMAQGAAFAAKARARAGNPAPHTDWAVGVICGERAEAAALRCDVALAKVSTEVEPALRFEAWRRALRRGYADLSSADAGATGSAARRILAGPPGTAARPASQVAQMKWSGGGHDV